MAGMILLQEISIESKIPNTSFANKYVYLGYKAKFQLGMAYYENKHIPKNPVVAKIHFDKAIEYYNEKIAD